MSFNLRIATPARDVFAGKGDYVSLCTPDGRAGFLSGALPRVAVLSAGLVEITIAGEKMNLYCVDGIYSITADGMTIVTSCCSDFENPSVDAEPIDCNLGRQERYVRARIAASLIKMKGNKFPEETF
ncbi:MAG: hypothetical protein K2L88_02395 [Clostridiales bacterium]|nr:hypothetical protein [Clostridiales bacterium]